MAQSDPSPAIGSDAWMQEQQLRAEWEAAEWRRLREEMANASRALPPPGSDLGFGQPVAKPWYEGGSAILKGLVRVGIGAFGAWMGYIAAANSDVGSLEIWMAVVVGFFGALVLSLIGPAREFVALLAEITRWVLIIALAIGAFWLVSKLHTS